MNCVTPDRAIESVYGPGLASANITLYSNIYDDAICLAGICAILRSNNENNMVADVSNVACDSSTITICTSELTINYSDLVGGVTTTQTCAEWSFRQTVIVIYKWGVSTGRVGRFAPARQIRANAQTGSVTQTIVVRRTMEQILD